jgi:putative addiction module component (TIGR02574 family)
MNIKELFEESSLLPIDKKIEFIDLLLDSIQNTDLNNQTNWTSLAHKRLKDIQTGKVKKIASETVFSKIEQRFY